MNYNGSFHGSEVKCSCCGKSIWLKVYSPSEYVYKVSTYLGIKYFCSWTCMRKYQRENNLLPEQQDKKTGEGFCNYQQKVEEEKTLLGIKRRKRK